MMRFSRWRNDGLLAVLGYGEVSIQDAADLDAFGGSGVAELKRGCL